MGSARCGRCLVLHMGTLGTTRPHSAQQGRIWPRGAAPGSHSPAQVPGLGHSLATSSWCHLHEGHSASTRPDVRVRVWGSWQGVMPAWAGDGDNPRVTAETRSHHPLARSPASDPSSDPASDPRVTPHMTLLCWALAHLASAVGSPASRLMSHQGSTGPCHHQPRCPGSTSDCGHTEGAPLPTGPGKAPRCGRGRAPGSRDLHAVIKAVKQSRCCLIGENPRGPCAINAPRSMSRAGQEREEPGRAGQGRSEQRRRQRAGHPPCASSPVSTQRPLQHPQLPLLPLQPLPPLLPPHPNHP